MKNALRSLFLILSLVVVSARFFTGADQGRHVDGLPTG